MLVTDIRSVRFPAEFIPAFRRALARERSPAEAATLMRETGYETGETLWAAFEGWAADQAESAEVHALPADRFWDLLSAFFAELGWGTLQHSQPHPGVAALDGTDWMEADPESALDQPGCHFTTGLVADLLRRVVDEDLAVLEVECRSRGDAHCRFLVGSPATLEAVYQGLAGGASHADALSRLG